MSGSGSAEVPVLIVGAGPVGLAMAVELGWRGIPCSLIEQSDGHVENPRTGLIAVRTMEAFRRWGMAEKIRQCGFPDHYELSMVFATQLNGHLLGRERYPSMAEAPTPPATPEKKQRCPQLWMHPILEREARSRPEVALHYEHRLESFEDRGDSVVATVRDLKTGRERTIITRYLVACDGAASSVRQRLGIAMPGRLLGSSINILFRCPNLVRQHAMGEAERYLLVGREGTWANITVVDGADIWRMTVLGTDHQMDLAQFDAVGAIRRALGRNDIAFEVLSVDPWRRSEKLADHFQQGRVLLAGDAVHTMSPTGGMGMNTGMQEVLDLGWKLQGALSGWGGPQLLASYSVERRPVAARNIAFSTANFKAWMDVPNCSEIDADTPEGARQRVEMGQRLRDSTRVEWESLGLQIGYRYDDSPICIADGAIPPPDDYSHYTPSTCPGARAPHAWLPDGRSTLDLFGAGFTLLQFAGARRQDGERLAAAFASAHAPLRIEALAEPEVARLYAKAMVLVRPDGHVAWRGDTLAAADEVVRVVTGHA